MIIHNLDIKCASVIPAEADSPSSVDTNAVLSDPVAFQRYEAVAGRYGQIMQSPRTVQIEQFPPRRLFERHETRDLCVIEQALSIFALEGLDHTA
jgi:hypothetical protein